MRRLVLASALLLSACGGSSPTSPSPSPTPSSWTLSGTVTSTQTGAPVPGASLNFGNTIITSNANGAWSLSGSGSMPSGFPVAVTAAGYLDRETMVRTVPVRSDITIDLIQLGTGFSLDFYRQLTRNALDAPGGFASEPLRRWTKNPNFYINTLNPKTGAPISAAELTRIEDAVRVAVPQATGGLFQVGTITSGAADVGFTSGTVNVRFIYDPSLNSCASAFVGSDPGQITINYDRCSCGGFGFSAETVAHEVGHAMGFRHASSGIMDTSRLRVCGNTSFSAAEQYHARIAYARQPGNLDLDRDASGVMLLNGSQSAPVVQCYR